MQEKADFEISPELFPYIADMKCLWSRETRDKNKPGEIIISLMEGKSSGGLFAVLSGQSAPRCFIVFRTVAADGGAEIMWACGYKDLMRAVQCATSVLTDTGEREKSDRTSDLPEARNYNT